jgi:uncharacterized repeat protein (TIGR03803 family)
MKTKSCLAGFLMFVLCAGIPLHAQTFTTLANFNGTNGSAPGATLTLDGNGNIYGTTLLGGNLSGSGDGTVFKLTTNGMLSILVSFNGDNGDTPRQPLILVNNTLYGTVGSGTGGTIFSVNTNGSNFTNLYDFGINNTLGGVNGLLLSSNTFYGTTGEGGGFNGTGDGDIFCISTNGLNFANMFVFDKADGGGAQGTLVLSGNTLYGVSDSGGSWDAGTVFAINTDGTGFTNLCSFTGSDGISPQAGLILSGNTLYGTASGGGNFDAGTIFAVNTDGTGFKTLYDFAGGNDGASPSCSLILIGNTLYGTAYEGGSFNLTDQASFGTVFSFNIDDTNFTVLHTFSIPVQNATNYVSSTATNDDGYWPEAGLTLLGNTLFGTTTAGGTYGHGTVFALSLPVPTLGMTTSGNQIILSWPTSAANFNLQTSTDLINWANITNGRTTFGGNYTCTNSMNGHAAFFRLQTQ